MSKVSSHTVNLHPLSEADIPLGLHLSTTANWNQTEADWAFFLQANQGGNFIALYQDQAAGVVTNLPYGQRFNWVGMLLVDPIYRRKGIGTRLLEASIKFGQQFGTVRLDATPAGKQLYDQLGFRVEREILRMVYDKEVPLPSGKVPCHPLTLSDLAPLRPRDALIFGADRIHVLQSLLERGSQYAFYAKRRETIAGYCLGRPGRLQDYIGPIIAENQEMALSLLHCAMANRKEKPVALDAFTHQHDWITALRQLGFQPLRPLIRMYHGELNHPGMPDLQYAIAGPELG